MFLAHEKANHITADTAAKAVKDLFVGINDKGRCFFMMKRTKSFKITAGFFEGRVITNYLNNIAAFNDLIDDIIWDQSHKTYFRSLGQ